MEISQPATDSPERNGNSTPTFGFRLSAAQDPVELSEQDLGIPKKNELLTSNESKGGMQNPTLKSISDDPSHGPQKPLSFMDLPLELRQKIYDYLPIPRNKSIEPRGLYSELFKVRYEDPYPSLRKERVAMKTHNLYYVSKQISEEILPILYGQNTFEIDWFGFNGQECLARLSEANRRDIRKVCIFATAPSCVERSSYAPRKLPKDAVWSPILPNLRNFQIVLTQPDISEDKFGWLYLEGVGPLRETQSYDEKMQMWLLWTKTCLEYFVERLSDGCCVEVDTGECEMTAEVVVECLGSKYVQFDHPWRNKMEAIFEGRFGA